MHEKPVMVNKNKSSFKKEETLKGNFNSLINIYKA